MSMLLGCSQGAIFHVSVTFRALASIRKQGAKILHIQKDVPCFIGHRMLRLPSQTFHHADDLGRPSGSIALTRLLPRSIEKTRFV